MVAEEKAENFEKTSGLYCSTVFTYLSYVYDKADAEEEEDKFQEQIREQKRMRTRH